MAQLFQTVCKICKLHRRDNTLRREAALTQNAKLSLTLIIRDFSSASEVTTTATRWLDPVTGATHEPDMRRSVSDNGPTGSDGVPSDTTEDDWSRGSAEDPDEVPSPSSSPSPAEPPEHTGPITELDRKVSYHYRRINIAFIFQFVFQNFDEVSNSQTYHCYRSFHIMPRFITLSTIIIYTRNIQS